MCDGLHHLFHRVHNGRVPIRRRLLQGRWGKCILAIPISTASVLWRPDVSPPSVSQIFGFIATIAFALDFYLIFNELAMFLKEGGQTEVEPSRQRGDTTNQQHDGGSAATLEIAKFGSGVDVTLTRSDLMGVNNRAFVLECIIKHL